jgi:hypothetical protein
VVSEVSMSAGRLALALVALLGGSPALSAHAATAAEPAAGAGEMSETDVNKKLTNPISDIWSLTFQNNLYYLRLDTFHTNRWQDSLNFQPVIPLPLTRRLNLISRAVFNVVNSTPRVSGRGELERTTAFGDTIFASLLASNDPHLLIGVGPSFVFPTASSDATGQGKWQSGAAAVLGYLSEKWIVGVFPQQWWSTGGSGPRQTEQLNAQYFFSYFLEHGRSIGTSPNLLVDWKADSGDRVTFPVGLSVDKVVKVGGKLPVRFGVQLQYMPVHPDDGQRLNAQLIVSPVLPSLVKSPLFGGP